jgi:hypothetical protein
MLKKSIILLLSTTALFALDVDKSVEKIKNVKTYGIKFGLEKGNKPIVLAEKYLAAKADYDGYKAAFGIFKTDSELKNGFNLKTLSVGYAIHDYDFYNYDLNKNESGDTTQMSFNVEGGYKTKMFYFNMFANMKTEGDDISSGYSNPGDTAVEYIHLGMSLKATFSL